jgi:DNA-binding response OmpR family regulator
LELRIKALTKRSTPARFFTRKDIEIDLDAQSVSQKGKKIPMSHKEFLLLELLCEYRGTSVSRTQLLDEIRGEDAMR